ncbi:unnamed protein product [Symbiodinium natans]|uniref:Uncharacterized protein n=1 Tax=Symbiodinium natans TaxID=878477 RepID=A0A812UL27_9DINO|nr:unnamed protein product [Symbiodinium natans]
MTRSHKCRVEAQKPSEPPVCAMALAYWQLVLGTIHQQPFLVICVVALTWLQWETIPSFPVNLLQHVQRKGKEKAEDSRETALSARVDEKLANVQAHVWRTASRILVHLNLVTFLVGMVDYQLDPGFTRLWWLLVLAIVHILYLLGAIETLEQTRERIHFVCTVINGMGVATALASAWESKEDYLGRTNISMTGQILFALIFPAEKRIIAQFGVLYMVAYCYAGISTCGPESVTGWFVVQQLLQLVVVMLVPTVIQSIVRDQIKASLESQDADSLVSAFRHLLKGVSDGDLLLDSNFNICGNASCLQRLLGTHEDFNGRNFLDLITEPGSVPFSKFLVAEGGGSSASATPGSKCPNMPQGVRVHLQGSGCEVPVDVFHVVLPELYGTSATHHLLAIMEHSEPCVRSVRSEPRQGAAPASLPEGKEGKEDVFTESHERGSEDMDASHMVQQFAEQLAQQFNVLSDLTLLVNANTELIDIEEAVMHFAHNDAVEMTSLNGLVPPREWHGIKSKLHQFARATRSRRPKPSSLPSMVLRFPGQEEDTYLRARRVSIEPVYSATFHEAEPTLVYLRLSKFSIWRQTAAEAEMRRQLRSGEMQDDVLRTPCASL